MMQSHSRTARLGAALATAALAWAGPAVAASQRTFVSTSGVDNPACSIASPCRTFGAAISAVNPGGEVIVLNSGGYGAVAITQSVSILAPAGIYAGVSVFSGDGITITTSAATDKVVLQGLVINNQGSVSSSGIRFSGAGSLDVARTRISGFLSGSGVRFEPAAGGQGRLHAVDLTAIGNGWGLSIIGGATLADTASAALERFDASAGAYGLVVASFANVVVTDSAVTRNVAGVYTDATTGTTMLLTLDRCNVSGNTNYGLYSQDDLGATYATITASTIAQNGTGLRAGSNYTARLAGTAIAQNGVGIDGSGTGTVQSQGNNLISRNTIDGPAPIVVGSK